MTEGNEIQGEEEEIGWFSAIVRGVCILLFIGACLYMAGFMIANGVHDGWYN